MVEHIPLEITSSSRNRNLYPNPFHFEVTLNNSGDNFGALAASDPITDRLPFNLGTYNNQQQLLEWEGLDINVTGTIDAIHNSEVVVTLILPYFQDLNYYKGLNIIFTTGWSIVKEYTFLGSNMAVFKVDKLPLVLPLIGSAVQLTFTSFVANNFFEVFVPKTISYGPLEDALIYNETLDEFRSILMYSSETSIAIVDGPAPLWSNTHIYSIRKNVPFRGTIDPAPPPTTSSFQNNDIAAVAAEGDFIRNDTTLEIVKVLSNVNGLITYTPSTPLPWAIGEVIELLTFTKDNSSFITFTSLQREAKTSEFKVTLNSLILPNICAIKDLPYVYLEITDKTNPISNTFMSNNPGNKKALFKATFEKKYHNKSVFIKFIGDGASKVLKFKPSSIGFRCSILKPSGEVINLWLKDALMPYPPNFMLQWSATLTFIKV